MIAQNPKVMNITEKIIATLTYPSCGILGIIWLIVSFGIIKKTPKPITLYHIYQSIFLWMLIAALSFVLNILTNIIISIPIIGTPVGNIILFFNTPVYMGLSIVGWFILLLCLYLMICASLGRYSNLPFVSGIIKQNVERRC